MVREPLGLEHSLVKGLGLWHHFCISAVAESQMAAGCGERLGCGLVTLLRYVRIA